MMKLIIVAFLLVCFDSCSDKNQLLTNDLDVVNTVLEDTYKNLEYEVEGIIHPTQISSTSNYNKDFDKEITGHINGVFGIDEMIKNMIVKESHIMPNENLLYNSSYFKPHLGELPNRLPKMGSLKKVHITFSVVGYNSDKSACIIIMDKILSSMSGNSTFYYLKKNKNGKYLIIKNIQLKSA